MDEQSDYEILCTASGYILRAFPAAAPAIAPYTMYADSPPMYYISIGAFYMALCDGSQIFMTAFIDSSIRLYRKVGKRFFAISRSGVKESKLTLNDLYITYDQCTTVMLHFFVQIAYIMDPTTNIEALMHKKHDDTCMTSTIQWIQNLEYAIKLTSAKLSVSDNAIESDRLKHVFAKGYGVAALPYLYMLFQQHLLHITVRSPMCKHPLGKRRLLPMIALLIEGYMVFNSTQIDAYKDCRSIASQNVILLRLNLSMAQQAETNAKKLITEEMQEEDKLKRKAEKKRAKRLRKKQKKEIATIEQKEDDTESDLDSVEILMDEFPQFSIMRRRWNTLSSLSPDADPFIPY